MCGAEIDESQYQRFLYTSDEYKDLLKSKQKALNTIDLALKGCNEDVATISEKLKYREGRLVSQKGDLEERLQAIDEVIDFQTVNDIDDKLLELREVVARLSSSIETETKLEKLAANRELLRDKREQLDLRRKELENKAQQDIRNKVAQVSEIYNRLIRETLPDSASARITLETYMPQIDDGTYREASALVSKRLMYYLALLELSFEESSVAFPRFLLVDTPETAGIELENLLHCLSKFEELEEKSSDFQIILTTGLSKYPPSFKNKRVVFLPDKGNRLLQRTELG